MRVLIELVWLTEVKKFRLRSPLSHGCLSSSFEFPSSAARSLLYYGLRELYPASGLKGQVDDIYGMSKGRDPRNCLPVLLQSDEHLTNDLNPGQKLNRTKRAFWDAIGSLDCFFDLSLVALPIFVLWTVQTS